MKNMLFISHRDNLPFSDGGKIAAFFGMNALSKKFNISYAFLVNKKDENTTTKYEPFGIKAYPFQKNTDDNYLKYPKTIFSRLSFKFNKFYCKEMLDMLCKIIEENSIEIVWCSQSQVSKYGIELKRRYPYLSIYLWEHNIEYDLVKQYAKGSSNIFIKLIAYFEYLKTKTYEINSWNKFDEVFFISDTDLNKAQKYCKKFNQNNVIYTPIKPQKTSKKVEIEENSFIFCGSLKSYQNKRNLNIFIKTIWQTFVKKCPLAKLYITGNEDSFLLKNLNMTKGNLDNLNIINLGYVDDIQQVIQSKKYYLSPTYYGSGIRIKVLEALSLKQVVFITSIDYKMANCLKDMENVVVYNNNTDFYNKYKELEQNFKLYSTIGDNAFMTFQNFFSEQMFYNRIINNIQPERYENDEIISIGKDCALPIGKFENTKISIVIPVYNVEKYLPKCLDSLINQTYSNIEIICVNDGSADSSLHILEEYANKDERIKIINQENQGVSVARNVGIDNATGDYILFVDSDDWLETNACEEIIKNLTPDIDILFFGYKNIKNNRIQQSFYYDLEKDIYNFPKDAIQIFNKLYCKNIWEKIYKLSYIKKHNIKFPIDSAFGEDTYFIINNIIHNSKIKIMNDTLYNYRMDTNNSLTKINLKKQLDSLILLLNKLNDLFVENNVDKILQLKICDDTYWFMFLLWNLYYSEFKKEYLEAIKNAKLFYSQYPIEELIKLKGYKRLQKYLSLQKYHVMWLYLNIIRPIGKHCIVLPYRRIKEFLRNRNG